MEIDFIALNASLLSRAEQLLAQWLPGGKIKSGEWYCGNLTGIPGESCKTNLATGVGSDFATGETWKDLIALYAKIHSLSQIEAAKQLGGESFAKPNGHARTPIINAGAPVIQAERSSPAPLSAPYPPPHYKWGDESAAWRYFEADLNTGPILVVCRYDPPEGKKEFCPYTWRDNKWVAKGLIAPRPLYRLRELLDSPTLPVLVVEGEKCAEAAQAILPSYSVVTWCGGAQAVKKTDWAPLKGRQIIIWPDADIVGRESAAVISAILLPFSPNISVVSTAQFPEGWDVADAIIEHKDVQHILETATTIKAQSTTRITRANPQPAKGIIADEKGEIVRDDTSAYVIHRELGLECNLKEQPYANAANIQRIVLLHQKYANRLYWDTFRMRKIFKESEEEREWSESDACHMLVWVQEKLKMPKITKSHIYDGIAAAAYLNKRNSLVAWLETLEWDGIERLPTFLRDIFKAEETEYTRDVGRCWLISMIARAYQPGCQVDTMVVLEGGQGVYKSSALAVLGGPYYAALPANFGNRDFLQSLDGTWLAEIPDMSGFKGRDIEHVKAIITTRFDRYCRRYSHDSETYPRQCVFAATANRDDWNEDETGARRFWPVKVGNEVNINLLRELRDKFFAEAIFRFKKGESWWNVDKKLAADQQALRRAEDAWEPAVRAALANIKIKAEPDEKNICTIPQIFSEMNLSLHMQGKAEQMRIARILRDEGWLRRTAYHNKQVLKQWFKPSQIEVIS